MLRKMIHKKFQKKIWIILAILVLPPFLIWAPGSMLRSRKEEQFAGTINGKKISLLELKNSIDAIKNQALIQFGDKLAEMQKYIDFKTQAWERLVLLKEAQKRNITASDEEVVKYIQSYPFFQTNGVFDKRLYSQMLQYKFYAQPRVFEEQTRQNLILAKLYREITKNVTINDEEAKDRYRKLSEELSIYYILSSPQDFTKNIIVTDDEAKRYFANDSLQFKQPLSFNLEYVEMPIGAKDQQEIQAKVKKMYMRLSKKESFEKVAKANGLILKETGQFGENGPIPGIGWPPELLSLLTQTKTGQYLAPIHIDKSYYILKIKERKEPHVPEFNAVIDKVKEAMIKEKTRQLAKKSIEECFENLKKLYAISPKSADFDKAAKIYGLKSNSTGLFKYNSYIENIGASDKFWSAAEKLRDNQFSDIIEIQTGFYIIKPKTMLKFDEKKYEAEKEEFKQKLLLQKKQEQFLKFSEELKKQARAYLPLSQE